MKWPLELLAQKQNKELKGTVMVKAFNVWVTIAVSLALLITVIVSGAVKIQRVEDKGNYTDGRINSVELRIEKRLDRIENLLEKIRNGN